MPRPKEPAGPFRYFNSSPEVIRLAVMMYVKFASVHANIHNHFNSERYLVARATYKALRSAALAGWRSLMA